MKRCLSVRKFKGALFNTSAGNLEVGQRVRVGYAKTFGVCIAEARSTNDGYAVIEIRGRKERLSPGMRVQIPLEEHSVLGSGVVA
ncbi:MAG: hypothetical protein JNJ83_11115 [Verrucomicrobiaceae bacterium]|nr:hypothetical protein [Verrucomicrobiaceae bacterium]